uniref:CDP-diacylglycerol--glycerol-3-phosphate 3-phosphatidyltransferase n=1 Tax=Dictyoglomus thermophilum TaxID=14 RepID=A0A7C3RKQ5_DICTH
MNIPNFLTIFRIFLTFPILLLFPKSPFLSFALFLLAILTDYLDGEIARRYNKISNLGKFLDPLADKILVISVLIYFVSMNLISPWIVIFILFREFMVTGLRMALLQKNIILPALRSGKIKTVFQDMAIIFFILSLPLKEYLIGIALILTLYSGAYYFYKYGKEIF